MGFEMEVMLTFDFYYELDENNLSFQQSETTSVVEGSKSSHWLKAFETKTIEFFLKIW